MIHLIRKTCLAGAMLIALSTASAQPQSIVLDRDGGTIVFEPYAPNIIRVTLSMLREPATAAPGYGFVAHPSAAGWSRQGDVYRSSRLVVTLHPNRPGTPLATQLDIAKFFNGSTPAAHITIATPGGKMLADLKDWAMSVPNYKTATRAYCTTGVHPTRRSTRWAPRLHRPITSTTTVWAKTRRASSITAATPWNAGTTTRPQAARLFAYRSW